MQSSQASKRDSDLDMMNVKNGDFNENTIQFVRPVFLLVDQVKHRAVAMARKSLTIKNYRHVAQWFDQLKSCVSPYLVQTYKAKLRNENELTLYTEFMDCYSLKNIFYYLDFEKTKRKQINLLGRCIEPIILGLRYLNEEKKIAHGSKLTLNLDRRVFCLFK
jgi:hypothetical protein